MSATPSTLNEYRTGINASPTWEKKDETWLQPFLARANEHDGTADDEILEPVADDAEVVA